MTGVAPSPAAPVPGATPGAAVPGASVAPGSAAPTGPGGVSPGAAGSLDASAGLHLGTGQAPDAPPAPPAEVDRVQSLGEQNTLWGTTGLLRTVSASSGAPGTFRLHFLADWFSASSFLCADTGHYCLHRASATSTTFEKMTGDSATHYGARIGLSVTPLDFLEAYASVRSESNSNTGGNPTLLQVLGDTSFGVKAFTPQKIGIFSFGGALDLLLLNGAGSVGLNGSATSLKLRALSTADFRRPNGEGLPLRAHLNIGYFLDNSSAVIEDTESARLQANDARGNKITRIERFGLDVNRVDQVQLALGVEGMFSAVRPFVEWSLGIPYNRQDYRCATKDTAKGTGDMCLASNQSFSSMPSTLTLGLRANPWLKGFWATAALDIGTSGTSDFLEELAPTAPWDLWLGLGYAFDIVEPPPKAVVVEKPVSTEPLLAKVKGFVHEREKAQGLPNAIVRYDGRELTGMATSADGTFLTVGLPPGDYKLLVHADGYNDGQCTVSIPILAAAAPGAPVGAPGTPGAPGASAAPTGAPGAPGVPGAPMAPVAPGAPGLPATPGMPAAPALAAGPGGLYAVDCVLEPQVREGSITGQAIDATSRAPVASASVHLTDLQGKEVALGSDGGNFHVEHLPPGTYTVKAEASDYMLHVQQVEVRPREDSRAELNMNRRPKNGDVELTGSELKIKRQIHFDTDSARIMPDSTALLEEISDVLQRNPCVQQVEIQGHTDNTGTKEVNKSLSEQRALSVRDWLTGHGVEVSRLVSRGYGQDRPISPNVTPAGRERNRRVQFMILQKDKVCKAAPTTGRSDALSKSSGAGGAQGGGTAGPKKPTTKLPF